MAGISAVASSKFSADASRFAYGFGGSARKGQLLIFGVVHSGDSFFESGKRGDMRILSELARPGAALVSAGIAAILPSKTSKQTKPR